MARRHTSKRPLLGLMVAAALALSAQAGLAAPAQADNCWQYDPIRMACNYAGESVPRLTARWFNAPGGNNLRSWFENETADAYGGTVFKCTGYKPEGSGYGTWLGCGYGTFANWIGGGRSWLFIEHQANGPRVIYGQGRHWLPNA